MSILVTGATGFVGGALTRRLSATGQQVHIFVRESSNRWRLDNVSGLVEHNVDLRDAAAVNRAVKAIKPRIIYHCGVYGGFASQSDTEAIFATNLNGTINLLRACLSVGFERFISTGSSSEYGIKQTSMTEDDLPEPLGDYAVAKCAATMFCRSEALLHGAPIVIIRVFSPYGPWDDPARFIPSVSRTLLAGKAPQLATPGAVRDYLYIDDLLELYQLVTERSVAPGEIFNAGSGSQVTIAEVAAYLQHLTKGPKPLIGPDNPRRPEPSCWMANIDKTRLLGWTPKIDLSEGLSRTVAWIREYPN